MCSTAEALAKGAHGTALATPATGAAPRLVLGSANGSTHSFVWES